MQCSWMSHYGWMMSLMLGWFGRGLLRTTLAVAYQFAGGPVPIRGLGSAGFRVVPAGRPEVHKARS